MTVPGAVALTGLVMFVVMLGFLIAADITARRSGRDAYRRFAAVAFGLSMALFAAAIWMEVLTA